MAAKVEHEVVEASLAAGWDLAMVAVWGGARAVWREAVAMAAHLEAAAVVKVVNEEVEMAGAALRAALPEAEMAEGWMGEVVEGRGVGSRVSRTAASTADRMRWGHQHAPPCIHAAMG